MAPGVHYVIVPGRGGGGKRLEAMAAALRRPFAGERGAAALALARKGPEGTGSVITQFNAKATLDETGASIPWPATQPFGNLGPGAQTLVRTGAYREAWTGGSGAQADIGDRVISFGVDAAELPQVRTFQTRTIPEKREIPGVVIFPRKRSKTRPGDWAMRFYLGLALGVWMSVRRLEEGLFVPARRLSANPAMRNAVAALIRDAIVNETRPGGGA